MSVDIQVDKYLSNNHIYNASYVVASTVAETELTVDSIQAGVMVFEQVWVSTRGLTYLGV